MSGCGGMGDTKRQKNLTDSEKSAEDAAPGAVSQYKKTAAQTGLEFTWVETPFFIFKFLIKFQLATIYGKISKTPSNPVPHFRDVRRLL